MPSNTYTPPSSTSSNGASPNETGRIVRRRNRIPLSCAPCRSRKLKCNRGHPCDNCTKRGDIAACSYATPKKGKTTAANGANQSPDDMQNRIDKLEGMVLALITSGQQTGGVAAARSAINTTRSQSISSPDFRLDVEGADIIHEEGEGEDDSEVERVSKGLGVMKMDGNKSMYASESHWYTILAEIKEVKQFFAAHKEDMQKQYSKVRAGSTPASSFLLQGVTAKDKDEILASFPDRADCDRLITRYFNAYDPSVHVIHGPTFQNQYNQYWQDPSQVSIAWIGMCFAMMTLSLQSYTRAGDEPQELQGKSVALATEFRRLTAQCLMMSDITQPIPLILETLILHIQAEYGRSRDAEPGVLLMTALCVRLAMRMGYHRDPGPHTKQIPIFQAEIRRRVWAFVRKIDLLISFQFGMPAMIRSDHCDTKLPANVYDDELTEGMTHAVSARPSFETTPMTYMIAKCNITYLFGRIVERLQSLTNPPSYEEVLGFDRELRQVRARHPAILQMRPFKENSKDVANLIMQRIGLELVFLRSLYVLHRKFVTGQARYDKRYAYSRKHCIDAAMEMLAHQATLHEESKPGGRLHQVKWYISSLTTHDFLLAACLVSVDLRHYSQAALRAQRQPYSPHSPVSDDSIHEQRRDEMLARVEKCITIFESVKDVSMEAYKAAAMLNEIIGQVRKDFATPRTSVTHSVEANAAYGMFPGGQLASFGKMDDTEQSAAMSLTQLSGVSPGGGYSMPVSAPEKISYPAGMANLLNTMPERTGLTPNYSGEMPGSGITGGTSPFPGFDTSGVGNWEGSAYDWNMLELYAGGDSDIILDNDQMWPMALDSQGLPDLKGQTQLDQFGDASVFMGAGTPGGEARMM